MVCAHQVKWIDSNGRVKCDIKMKGTTDETTNSYEIYILVEPDGISQRKKVIKKLFVNEISFDS